MTTLKEMRQEIKDYIATKPDNEYRTGLFVTKIGYTYITIMSIWETTTISKMTIEDFYNDIASY